jgi:hypothetical protein
MIVEYRFIGWQFLKTPIAAAGDGQKRCSAGERPRLKIA